jgi:hypothetical protein
VAKQQSRLITATNQCQIVIVQNIVYLLYYIDSVVQRRWNEMQEVALAAACPTRQLSGARVLGDVKHGMSPKLILPQQPHAMSEYF